MPDMTWHEPLLHVMIRTIEFSWSEISCKLTYVPCIRTVAVTVQKLICSVSPFIPLFLWQDVYLCLSLWYSERGNCLISRVIGFPLRERECERVFSFHYSIHMYQRAAVRHSDCVRVSCGLLNYTVKNIPYNLWEENGSCGCQNFTVKNTVATF